MVIITWQYDPKIVWKQHFHYHGINYNLFEWLKVYRSPVYIYRKYYDFIKRLLWVFAMAFDDIIILSEIIEELLIHLEKVLKKLAKYGMFINFEKYQFAMNLVNFLGHNISKKGILSTVHNMQKLLDFSLPKDSNHFILRDV